MSTISTVDPFYCCVNVEERQSIIHRLTVREMASALDVTPNLKQTTAKQILARLNRLQRDVPDHPDADLLAATITRYKERFPNAS